jgi:hypothetical protein
VQLIRPVIEPGMLGHTASLVVGSKKSCDIQPRRPYLYKNVKVGQPARESDDLHEALSAFDHVKEFMEILSSRISARIRTPVIWKGSKWLV